MDENSFDRLIRSKLGEYEDPVYDENAFNQFHQNYVTLTHTSWLNRYRTEIIVISALLFFTLLNGGLMLSKKSVSDVSKPSGASFVAYEEKIDSLENVILATQKSNSASVLSNISTQDEAGQKVIVIYKTRYIENETALYQDTILLGASKSFSIYQISALRESGEVTIENGKLFYIPTESIEPKNRIASIPREFKISESSIDTLANADNKLITNGDLHEKNLSAKTKNDLEKHYFPGIGINIAPRVGLTLNAFDDSPTFPTPTVGLGLDFIVSPHFSFETAFEYGATKFQLSEDLEAYGIPNEPYYEFGPPDDVTITGRNIYLPISLKYRRWTGPKTELVLRGTATPYYLLSQEYVYSYSDKGGGYGTPGAAPTITKTVDKDGGLWSGTTIGLSAGFQKLYNKKHKIEGSLFVEHGLSKMKPQEIGMQLFGIKAAYWFRIK